MVNIFPLHNYPNLYTPKRLLRYVLVYCTEGSIDMVVDDKNLTVNALDVLTITSGQVHYLTQKTVGEGWVFEFTLDFFCKDDSDVELIFQNGLFCHFDMNEVISLPQQNAFVPHFQAIQQELQEQPFQYLTTVRARIELLLVDINRAKIQKGDEIWKPNALFLKFLELVRANFSHNYPLRFFAEKLQTSELKLNEQAKLFTGKTAQMVIYSLVISEAKRLLMYEDLTIKEIAFKLGFSDPFYFSNFFKKHTQISPKSFKEGIDK